MKQAVLAFALSAAMLAACGQSADDTADTPDPKQENGVVNVYSARHYDSDKDMYAAFEADTGIKVRLRESGGSSLLEAMKVEGESSPADMGGGHRRRCGHIVPVSNSRPIAAAVFRGARNSHS